MHQALYRKYRPAVFDDVCGQKHVTDTLRYEVVNGRASHAYLFTGSRGTGKTTCAKILAKVINCENPQNGSPCLKCAMCRDIDNEMVPDVVEMDAASHTGVDDIRDIIETVGYPPAIAKKKVYIIDEVHMLSKAAFNALLKTIEEPPEHLVFILATTETNKIPATIISRCQRFDFHRIDMKTIADRLMYIAEKEGFVLEEDAALILARQAEGGMRDAIGLLELCASGGADVTSARVAMMLGLSGYEMTSRTFKAVADKNISELFSIVDSVVTSSANISVFIDELVSYVRDMLVVRYSDNPMQYLDLTSQEAETLIASSKLFSLPALVYMAKVLDELAMKIPYTPQLKRVETEIALMRLASPELETSTDALNARIAKLEDAVRLGTVPSPAPAVKAEEKKTEEPKAEAIKAPAPTTVKKVETPKDDYSVLDDITEVTDRFDEAHRFLVVPLTSSRCSISADGTILKIEADGFAASLLSTEENKAALSSAFAVAGITKGPAQISVVKVNGKIKKSAPQDDLNSLF